MSKKISYDVKVFIQTAFIEDQSDPANNHYVFGYHITIVNYGDLPIKLLSRHWIITDANGMVQEVRGLGVVGEQPHLKPGERFEYTSGTALNTPVGCMQGSYEMLAEDGEVFHTNIEPFRLAMPNILH